MLQPPATVATGGCRLPASAVFRFGGATFPSERHKEQMRIDQE
jgi:hypothetical protein